MNFFARKRKKQIYLLYPGGCVWSLPVTEDAYRIWGYCACLSDYWGDHKICETLDDFWKITGYELGYWSWIDEVTDLLSKTEEVYFEDITPAHLAIIEAGQQKRLKKFLSLPIDKKFGGRLEDFRQDPEFQARRAYR